MNTTEKKSITLTQYIFAIHGVQMGQDVLTLPSDVAAVAGTDGWISVIIGSIITMTVSLCIVGIMAKHPGDTFLQVLTRYFGKWVGKACMIIWGLYFLMSVVVLLYFTILILKIVLLPQTPSYSLVLLCIIPVYMVIRGGARMLGRYAVFVFFFTIWMPLLLVLPLGQAHGIFLLPMIKEGAAPILYAVKNTVWVFLGFEVAFILYPYLKNKRMAAKGIVIANSLSLVIYLLITLACFSYFSPDEITQFIWTTLRLVKPIEFPFLERFEIVFLSFYLFFFSTSVIPYAFAVTNSVEQIFNKKDWQLPIYILLLGLFFASFFHKLNYKDLETLRIGWGWAGIIVSYIFPVALFLYVTAHQYLNRQRG
ncbi:endospore germination permease [Aneurinibacillus aneurinilyticus]|uniref:GerAB/ArcD/ProY family transporter n=1 Tax=Aneurinibacillus aneurinilyticus TaxID=1391 RepID=UPI002E20FC3C|nr:endospore germination permease [Aneurinibacillus aneurinilyticus]MED0668940.1 endospore germination permease [Aneurinibacillus aneurinilyticus]